MRRPSNNTITLGYGAVDASLGYTAASPHLGVDFSHAPDDRIYAPENGTITHVGWMGTAGNAVELTGADGRKWRFCHLQSFNVSVGQGVGEGHVLGIMGATGYAVGRHLHLILFINGTRTNPMSVLPSNVLGASNAQGDSDVITQHDAQYLRIINTEVKGYPLNETHRGDYDARELNAWVGHDWREFIKQGFDGSQGWRDKRVSAIHYYDSTRPNVEGQLATLRTEKAQLQSQLSTHKEQIASLTTQLEAARLEALKPTQPVVVTQPAPTPEVVIPEATAPVQTPTPTVEKPKVGWLTALIAALLTIGKKKS